MLHLAGHSSIVHRVEFHPTLPILCSHGGTEQCVRLWDLSTGEQLPPVACDQPVLAFTVAPDGESLAIFGGDRTLSLYALTGEREEHRRVAGPGRRSRDGYPLLALPERGELLLANVSGDIPADGTPLHGVSAWDAQTLGFSWTLPEPLPMLTAASLGDDEVVTASTGDVVLRIDPEEATAERVAKVSLTWAPLMSAHPSRPRVTFASLLSLFFVDYGEEWESGSRIGKRSGPIGGHKKTITSLTHSRSGGELFSGSLDGMVRVWDTSKGTMLEEWQWDIGPVDALAVAPHGELAAAAGSGGIVVWDVG